jgi:hypothetical protein
MSVEEYWRGIYRDFFRCSEDTGIYDFPCCVCAHRGRGDHEEPCKYCDHNANAEKSYFCALCQDHTPGDPAEENRYLAYRTPAAIGPLCKACINTIRHSAQ